MGDRIGMREKGPDVLIGKNLVADMNACRPGAGELVLWWLGQHGFAVKIGKSVIYLDPFLTDMKGRLAPSLLSPRDITNADSSIFMEERAG